MDILAPAPSLARRHPLRYFVNFPPPCRHRGRATASVLLGARGPDTIRRPRSRAPRVRGVAGASGATGPVGSPLVFVRAAGLFRCSGVTL